MTPYPAYKTRRPDKQNVIRLASDREFFPAAVRSRGLTVCAIQRRFLVRFQHLNRLLIALDLPFQQPTVVLVEFA